MEYEQFVKRYFLKYLGKPRLKDGGISFLIWSYNSWAIKESVIFVNNHQDMTITDALTLFVYTMGDYSSRAKSSNSSFMFATACDMGKDILDTWLAHFE